MKALMREIQALQADMRAFAPSPPSWLGSAGSGQRAALLDALADGRALLPVLTALEIDGPVDLVALRTALFHVRPETPDELHAWIRCFLGYAIPRVAVIPGHIAPFDFIAGCFFEDPAFTDVLLIASRGSGKTLATAILNVLEMHHKKCGIVSIGAILEQANKAGRYVDDFLDLPEFAPLVSQRSVKSKSLTGGGRLHIAPCTLRQTNAPHEPKVNIDEAELAHPEAFQEAKSIPLSDPAGNRASLRILSTRKFVFGNVQAEIEKAPESGLRVLMYSYQEVAEKCPDQRSGSDVVTVYVDPDELEWVTAEDYDALPREMGAGFGAVDVFDGCLKCALLPTCRGDLKNAGGWMPVADIVAAYRRNSLETWRAQWECRRPSPTGLVYKHFTEERNIRAVEFHAGLPTFWAIDWGYTDPTACLLLQRHGRALAVVDEIALVEMDSNQVKLYLTTAWCGQYGHPEAILADPSGANERRIFTRAQAGIPGDVRYRTIGVSAPVADGIDLVRTLIRPLGGETRLLVHPRCENLIRCMSLYHYRTAADGSVTETPDHEHSHFPDALRYGAFWIFKRGKTGFIF